jgi:hypothetical protein
MPVQKSKEKGQNMKDLVQIDADTAMLLYSKGLTHLPVLKRDGYSSDWTAAQPLYLDDIIEDLMIFCQRFRAQQGTQPAEGRHFQNQRRDCIGETQPAQR